MIKISDERADNTKQLKDIETNGFFFYDDVLCRRVETDLDVRVIELGTDEILVYEVATGELTTLSRKNWVEPIADRQIFLTIDD